jgi:hypothetical protein
MNQHNWRCDHPGCQKMAIDRSRRYSERIVCEELALPWTSLASRSSMRTSCKMARDLWLLG